MAGRMPPRYVPTLTEVVKEPPAPAPSGLRLDEKAIVDRVLQRIDLVLERRVREVVAATVVEQTRHLVPALREDIERVVREAVSQAVAEEAEALKRSG